MVERMKELSGQYSRYGRGRIRIFLGRDGRMSPGRTFRLWRAARLAVATQAPEEARRCCLAAPASAVWAEPGMVL